jgi:hypothetical protein
MAVGTPLTSRELVHPSHHPRHLHPPAKFARALHRPCSTSESSHLKTRCISALHKPHLQALPRRVLQAAVPPLPPSCVPRSAAIFRASASTQCQHLFASLPSSNADTISMIGKQSAMLAAPISWRPPLPHHTSSVVMNAHPSLSLSAHCLPFALAEAPTATVTVTALCNVLCRPSAGGAAAVGHRTGTDCGLGALTGPPHELGLDSAGRLSLH